MQRLSWSLFIVLCLPAFARAELPSDPSLAELEAIAGRPHLPQLSAPELRIYPVARKYRVSATRQVPDGEAATVELDADEKWVDGRYIVSFLKFPGLDEPVRMVVAYDAENHCYRKWVFSSKGIGEAALGTRVGTSRTVSWVSPPVKERGHLLVVSQEAHTDRTTEWSELHWKDGRIVARVHGKATAAE